MARLEAQAFMEKVKGIIGDRDDDEALSFLEDCKDTITAEKDDYKEKYEQLLKEKEELDKSWRTKYKERFYSADNPPQDNDKDKGKGQASSPFDTRTEEQRKAEETTIDSLFSEETN